MDYYTLGNTGLKVSRLALGTMTFGDDWGWGADESNARQLFDAYLEAGGNFIDTADLYTNGNSEQMLGRFVKDNGTRDRVVITTKFSYNSDPGNPNAGAMAARIFCVRWRGLCSGSALTTLMSTCCTPGTKLPLQQR
jgi:aryl-alcohol dehydrogenase-like predicted oxidoreductase